VANWARLHKLLEFYKFQFQSRKNTQLEHVGSAFSSLSPAPHFSSLQASWLLLALHKDLSGLSLHQPLAMEYECHWEGPDFPSL
jgi:hypothetical protein